MSQGPQYTSCVEATDFKTLNKALLVTLGILIGGGTIASIFSGGIGAIVAIVSLVQLLRYVLDFMLNGKLICLHHDPANGCNCSTDDRTVCAIGEVADTEDVGEDKNPVADIDNDYGINLILAPFDMLTDFVDGSTEKNLATATAAGRPQGDLLRAQPGMPSDPGFSGYFRTMVYLKVERTYKAWTEIIGRDYGWFGIVGPDEQKAYGDYLGANKWLDPVKFEVPVLHCEFEGSRIRDMLSVIEAFSLGGGWCKKNWFFRLVCVVLQSIFAPVILVALAAAWAAASDGNVGDALVGGGTINSKDQVIVRGRWTYDGGHTGWNEIHATRIVQKVDNIPVNRAEFEKFRQTWCDRMSEIPRVTDPGLKTLSPAEQATYDNQQRPENQWTLHPDIDGCSPQEAPPIIK